jgi:hypothetical protein
MVITLQNRKPSFLHIFSFRDLSDVKWTQFFRHISFSRKRRLWVGKVNVKSHEAGERGNTQAHLLAAWWAPSHGPDFFASMESSWPKANYIYMTPRFISWWGGEEMRIHNTNRKTASIVGEPLLDMLPVSPLPPSTSSPYHHDEEVEVTCINLSTVLH